jgi:hypothetical protein
MKDNLYAVEVNDCTLSPQIGAILTHYILFPVVFLIEVE